jgi:uncharacterized caspase-like protein
MKKNHNRLQKLSLVGITSLLVLICGVSSAKKFNKGQITPDQLYIVDCLLPPQVRQLGQNHTYLSPRKPAKLSAHECALRGGEYVAYDRASFSSAAKTWLPDAQKGSAKAQSYMGELYENGINGTADYKSAAMWYQKAVDQGYTPAMLNLGNLYEQGLGVEKDTTKAINLYRMASGVSDAKLELVTEKNLRERRAKEHQRIKLLKEVSVLKQQLSKVKSDYNLTKKYVQQSDLKLKDLQAKLKSNKGDNVILQKIADLKSEINKKNEELNKQNKVINTLVTKVTDNALNQDVAQNSSQSGINVLTPDVVLTRGVRTIPLQPNATDLNIIGSVFPPEGVIALKVNNEDIKNSMTEGGVFEGTINLQSGDTPVNIIAVRKDGSKNIEQFVAIRSKFEPVQARHFDELFTRRLRDDLGDYYALVIGNNNYKNLDNLTTAVQDAEKIAEVLKKKYKYKVKLLTNADHVTMLKALSDYKKKLGKYDNLMVYYAGHGLIDEDSKEGYWIPTDASKTDKASWIPNKAISDFMAQMKAKHVMIVADSCYSGTLSGSSITPLPEQVDNEDILFTSRVKARTVLTSGGLQPILDSGGNGHSIFASAFLDVLNENDGVMEGYRLYRAMSQQVRLRSSLAGLKQVPEYSAIRHAGHEGSEYYFLPSSI